jgi:riboflavin transporter FmnP
MEGKDSPDTLRVALTVSLAALAAMLSYMHVSAPFPLMPFLQYDAAEVPDLLSFFLLGPSGAMAVTTIHWMALNLHSSFDPVIGPTMKFMAVFSNILGLYVATLLLPKRPSLRRSLATLLVASSAIRATLMLAPTFALYYFISPNLYLPFAVDALAKVGIVVDGALAGAVMVTVVTAIFNVTQGAVSVMVTWMAYRSAGRVALVQARADWLKRQTGLVS